MVKLVLLMTIQSTFLVLSQVLLKLGLRKTISSESLIVVVKSYLFNLWIVCAVISLVISGVVWIYVLKRFEFSLAYPLVSISYIIAMVMSYLVFKETITLNMVIGVLIIVVGVVVLTIGKN